MKVVSLVKDTISTTNSGATYKYEYYNKNGTCSATNPSYTAYSSGSTYNTDDYVYIDSIKRVFRCASDSVSSKFPPAYPSLWTDYGAINSFALFDNTLTTQTESAVDFTVTFDFNRINTFALLNMSGLTSVRIRQVDNSDSSTVVDKTVSLRDYGALGMYDYWYKPIRDIRNYKQIDMQWLPSSVITLDFTSTDSGKIGAVVSGYLDELGCTLYGSSVGFDDNSIYTTDDYGIATFNVRPAIDILDAEALINTGEVDYTIEKLKRLRGTTSLYIGDERDDGFQSMVVLGYIRKLRMGIENPVKTKFPISIIGVA